MTHNPPSLGWTLLYVDDVPSSVEFYTRAFGLTVRFAAPSDDYAEFETGSTTLSLCARSLAGQSAGLTLDRPTHPGGNVTLVYADVPAAFERAVAAGATDVKGPATKPWGQVTSFVSDSDGNLIELATAIG